jgi:hypothetical protein
MEPKPLRRGEHLKSMPAQLVVDLWLYPTDSGGRKQAIPPGWGSPCTVQAEQGASQVFYDGWPLLGDRPMSPGERRRVGYVFLSGREAVDHLRAAPKFYVWEGGLIGEATIAAGQGEG